MPPEDAYIEFLYSDFVEMMALHESFKNPNPSKAEKVAMGFASFHYLFNSSYRKWLKLFDIIDDGNTDRKKRKIKNLEKKIKRKDMSDDEREYLLRICKNLEEMEMRDVFDNYEDLEKIKDYVGWL
jgi:hypothetical protein